MPTDSFLFAMCQVSFTNRSITSCRAHRSRQESLAEFPDDSQPLPEEPIEDPWL